MYTSISPLHPNVDFDVFAQHMLQNDLSLAVRVAVAFSS